MQLQRRSNQIYYFRWVCPERVRRIVGKSELIRSLNTPNQLVAYARASRYYEAVQKIIYLLQMNRLSEEQLAAIIQRIWDRLQVTLATPLTFEMVDFNDGADEWIDDLLEEVSALRDVFDPRENRYASRHENWPELLTDYGLDPSAYHAEDRDRLHQELLRIRHEFFLDRITQIEDFKKNPPSPFSTIVKRQVAGGRVLFSELYARFMEHKTKDGLKEDMQKEYQRYYEIFIDLEGDVDISDIKRLAVKEFILQKCRYLPKRNLGQYRGRRASELLAMEISDDDLISDSTVKQIVKFLQGMFAFAVDKELIGVSPVRDLKLKLDGSNPYGAYSKAEIRKILEAAKSLKELWYWVLMLGIYTGARLGEIVQLRKVDVRLDEESNRHFIRVDREAGSVKTDAANRRIPLHFELLAAGFLEFVNKSPAEELFPSTQSKVATQWYRSFRQAVGIPDYDEHGHKLVFHSFRHTFVTIARANGGSDPSVVQEIVGHEKVRVGITDRYTHKFPISALCRVVDCIEFS